MTTRGSYELKSGAISKRKDERWKISVVILCLIIIFATIIVTLWILRVIIPKDDSAGQRCGNEDVQVTLFERLKQNVPGVTVSRTEVTETEPSTVTFLQAETEARMERVEPKTETTKYWVEKITTITEGTTRMLKPTSGSTEATTDETRERQRTMEPTTEMWRTVWQVAKKLATEMGETSETTTEMVATLRQTSSSFGWTGQISEGPEGTTVTENPVNETEDEPLGTEASSSSETTEQKTEFEPTVTSARSSETTVGTEKSTTVAQDPYEPDPCDEDIYDMRSHMMCAMPPCEDFHSYACAGDDFDSEERNLERDINERILNQAKAHPDSPASKLLMGYYNSCLSYHHSDETARLELAVASLDEIGQFYHVYNSSQVKFDLTDILYKLLAHDSAPLFDIDLEVDLVDPKELVFALRPRLRKSELYVEDEDLDCSTKLWGADESTYEALHNNYILCKHGQLLPDMEFTLNKMENFSPQMLSTKEAVESAIDVELNLFQPFLLKGGVHVSENYKRKTLSDWTEDLIKANGECVSRTILKLNLTRLLSNLSGKPVEESAILQIYFPDNFITAVRSVCEDAKTTPGKINNAFLALYVHHLYYQLVDRPRDPEDYCMTAVKSLLEPQASKFYMSSFTDEQLWKTNETVFAMFEELKETFRLKMKGIEWAEEPGREKIMEKLNSLSLILPQAALYEKSASLDSDDTILDSNFFDNTVRLFKRKRELTYGRWQKDPSAIEQIWTHFSVPYWTFAKAIYRLNSIVLPLGAVEWALSSYNDATYDLKLATLGNLISREMARQFDVWGLKYYRGNEAEASFFHNDEQAQTSYDHYANCHSTLSGMLSELGERTLNERLSDTVGLQLAYDTMMRMTSNSSLNISVKKRFFVAYAQMLCKRDRLPTTFWISLDAEEHLPASLRTSAVLSSIKDVGQAWRCDRGSPTYPQRFCSVFPKINTPEQEILDPSRK